MTKSMRRQRSGRGRCDGVLVQVFESDSHVAWIEGNFQDYEEDKKRRLGEGSVLLSRIENMYVER
jgi:hypothetical protein